MAGPERVGRVAVASLLLALALVVAGKALERPDLLPFWGGLLAAFGEAALVGGLADWFAVRALFAHPFGIPFPHTALIPRNRRRLIGEIRNLVLQQWLPRSVLIDKVKDPEERLWYARKTIENGWSRAVLVHWIESDLYSRQGKATTNFARSLPSPGTDASRRTGWWPSTRCAT